jgi:hypothetical protein
MPDHKVNLNAIIRGMLPPLCAPGETLTSSIQIGRRISDGIRLMTAKDIAEKTRIVDGKLQFRKEDNGWGQPPEGVTEVWELGKPVPPEKVTLTFALISILQDNPSSLVKVPGHAQPPRTVAQHVATLAEVNMAEWQAGNKPTTN